MINSTMVRPGSAYSRFAYVVLALSLPLILLPSKAQAFNNLSDFSEVHEWRSFSASNSDLPDNGILALTVDTDGALWAGTNGGGLARWFQGSWRIFNTNNSKLPSNTITAVEVDSFGTVWVGTFGGGLASWSAGAWQVFNDKNSVLPYNIVGALSAGPDGSVWVGTDEGLVRWHDGVLQGLSTDDSEFTNSLVTALTVGVNGDLWVGTENNGLGHWHNGIWRVFNTDNSKLPDNGINDLTIGSDGSVWVGMYGSGVARLHNGLWEVYNTENSELPSDYVYAVEIDAAGALWVGTDDDGLARWLKGTWRIFDIDNSDLPDNNINSVAAGLDGALWIGTDGGVTRWHPGSWHIINEVIKRDRAGIDDGIVDLTVDTEGSLWVGSDRDGLARWREGSWQVFTYKNSELPADWITAISIDAKGDVWVGISGRGLGRWRDGSWQIFNTQNSELPSDHVYALAADTVGAVWVGTARGLVRWHESSWQVFNTKNSKLPDDGVYELAVDNNGAVWAESDRALVRWNGQSWLVFDTENSKLPDTDISALVVDTEGTVWVGIYGAGVARWREESWEIINTDNSNLHDNWVTALAADTSGALWIGTDNGLARWHDESWQVFNIANSGLPDNVISTLALDPNGVLWIGTGDFNLARFTSRSGVLLTKIETLTELNQLEHTFAVRGFDSTYRTPNYRLRYLWQVSTRNLFGGESTLAKSTTSEPFYTAHFEKDGHYTIRVRASDKYGWLSDPENFEVVVKLPGNSPWYQSTAFKLAILALPSLYLILLLPLIVLYPRYSWVRSIVNSGVFTKFPVLHRLLVNTRWARQRLFSHYRRKVSITLELPHYIVQQVVPLLGGNPLVLGATDLPLGGATALGRFSLLVGRSGTGKSVLMSRIRQIAASQQARWEIPILLNAPIHLDGNESIFAAVKTVLRRDGKVELPNSILDFLVRKGGFLILVDSLNECPQANGALKSFINSDANNQLIVASQNDSLQHPDVEGYQMAEFTTQQAKAYLDERIEKGTWNQLSEPLHNLARNPKDLDLIAEVIENLGVSELPTRRAGLYEQRLHADTAIQPWVESADKRLDALFALAWRMLAKQRTLDLPTFSQWTREALSRFSLPENDVETTISILRRCRQFRETIVVDKLGREQSGVTFDHELVGKFLASRHMRSLLEGSGKSEVLAVADSEAWRDVFFFVIDDTRGTELPGLLLNDLVEHGGTNALAIVAYAIESRSNDSPPLPHAIRERYLSARLREDTKFAPVV